MNILILILILLLLNIDLTEGFQINRPPQDTPDDLQFIACHDYSNNNNLGNNNYKVKSHGISVPLQGPYSHFLNRYKLRNYDEVFHSPICEEEYSFTNNTYKDFLQKNDDSDYLPIIDSQDTNINELLKQEQNIIDSGLKDPYYVHRDPAYLGNKLIYSDTINELFIENHHSHDEENIMHAEIDIIN